jgi:hypothetical protein
MISARGDFGCGQRRRRRDLRKPAIRGNYADLKVEMAVK